MQYVVAFLVVAGVLAFVVAAVRGRVQVRSCCPADARHDLRMRDAFADEPSARGDRLG